MVRRCVAKNCNNTSNTIPKRSFFKFPKDIQRAQNWLAVCETEKLPSNVDMIMNNFSEIAICDAHFEECMFSSVLKNRLLKRALPTIFSETDNQKIDDFMIGEAIIIKEEPIDTCYSPNSTAIEEWPMEEYSSCHQSNPSTTQIKYQENLRLSSEEFHQFIHDPVQNDSHTPFVEDLSHLTRLRKKKSRSNKKCRICLVTLDRRKSARLGEKCHPEKTIKQMIQFCIPQRKVALSDKDYICRKCLKSVRLFVKFIEDFLKVEKQLKESEKAKETKSVEVPTDDVNVTESSNDIKTQCHSSQLRNECQPEIPQVYKENSRNNLSTEMPIAFTDSCSTQVFSSVMNSTKTQPHSTQVGIEYPPVISQVDKEIYRNNLPAEIPTVFKESSITQVFSPEMNPTKTQSHSTQLGIEYHTVIPQVDKENSRNNLSTEMPIAFTNSCSTQVFSSEMNPTKTQSHSTQVGYHPVIPQVDKEIYRNNLPAEIPTVFKESSITQVFSPEMNPTKTQSHSTQLGIEYHPVIPQVDKENSRNNLPAEIPTVFKESSITQVFSPEMNPTKTQSHSTQLGIEYHPVIPQVDKEISRNNLSTYMATVFTDNTITQVFSSEANPTTTQRHNTQVGIECHPVIPEVDKKISRNDISVQTPTVCTDSSITPDFSSEMNPTAKVNTGKDCFETYRFQSKIGNQEEKVHEFESGENFCNGSDLHFTKLQEMVSHVGRDVRCQKSSIEDNGDKENGNSYRRIEMGKESGSPVVEISEEMTENKGSFSNNEQVIEHKIDQKAAIHLCHICGYCFEAKSDLRKHMNLHVDHNTYLCDRCSKSFTTLKILNFHKMYSHGKKTSECKYCRKLLWNHSLLEHYKSNHCKDIKYICKICGEDFSKRDMYENHLRNHISMNHVKLFRKPKGNICNEEGRLNKRGRPECEV